MSIIGAMRGKEYKSSEEARVPPFFMMQAAQLSMSALMYEYMPGQCNCNCIAVCNRLKNGREEDWRGRQ
jgi:hypothetical protein